MFVALISTDSQIFSSSVRSVYVRALIVAGFVSFHGSTIVPYWKGPLRAESTIQTLEDFFSNDTFNGRSLIACAKKIPPKRTTTTTTDPMTNAAIKQLIAQGVVDALGKIKANRTSRNGDNSHDSGTGSRRTERAVRECTYSEFLKCQPLNFKGSEGVVSLTQWFKKMEMFLEESDEVKKYVGGLPDMI
ncbi:hypothetical protein Tco_0404549 [Tanacetum coccineum]